MVESNNINRSLLVLGTTKNKTLASLGIALSARPTGFLQFFDTVGLVIWSVKIVPDMTYNVLSATLSKRLHYYTLGIDND